MKQKKLPSRRSYKRRALLNGLLVLVVALLLWTASGFALPTRMAFRSMECQRLLAPSELLLDKKLTGGWRVLVGVTDSHIHVAAPHLNHFTLADRTGEPQLVALPDNDREAPTLAAVDAPAGTASVRLVMTLEYHGTINGKAIDWSGDYPAEGVLTDGLYLFRLERRYDPESRDAPAVAEEYWFDNGLYGIGYHNLPPYELTFYDAEGAVLDTVNSGLEWYEVHS